MISHWSWSEYVLLTSPGSGLACFSQHFNPTFPRFPAKHYAPRTPSEFAPIEFVWNFWFKSCSWVPIFWTGEHTSFESLGWSKGFRYKGTFIKSHIFMLLFFIEQIRERYANHTQTQAHKCKHAIAEAASLAWQLQLKDGRHEQKHNFVFIFSMHLLRFAECNSCGIPVVGSYGFWLMEQNEKTCVLKRRTQKLVFGLVSLLCIAAQRHGRLGNPTGPQGANSFDRPHYQTESWQNVELRRWHIISWEAENKHTIKEAV